MWDLQSGQAFSLIYSFVGNTPYPTLSNNESLAIERKKDILHVLVG